MFKNIIGISFVKFFLSGEIYGCLLKIIPKKESKTLTL